MPQLLHEITSKNSTKVIKLFPLSTSNQSFKQSDQSIYFKRVIFSCSPIDSADGIDRSGLPGRDEAGEDAEDDGYEHAGKGVVGGEGDGEVFRGGIDRNGNEEDQENAHQASGQGEEGGLHHELGQDHVALGSEGLLDADLAHAPPGRRRT